jgi:hypothetical protein
MIPSHLTLA